jgi:hypothetical protein
MSGVGCVNVGGAGFGARGDDEQLIPLVAIEVTRQELNTATLSTIGTTHRTRQTRVAWQ